MPSRSPKSGLILSVLAAAVLLTPACACGRNVGGTTQSRAQRSGLAGQEPAQGRPLEPISTPITMTGIGGMAMLMEGSTIREGKYKDNIRRAVDWLMAHSMPNGMIGNPNIPGEAGRYMYGHGFATAVPLLRRRRGRGRRPSPTLGGHPRTGLQVFRTTPRPIAAAGATSRPARAATSTKAR